MPGERRLTPKEWAEHKARENGYTGTWPPPTLSIPKTTEKFADRLEELEGGNHSTGVVRTALLGCAELVDQLEPKTFYRLGVQISKIVRDNSDSERTRLSAAANAITPLLAIAKMALAGRKLGVCNVISVRAEQLIQEFIKGVGQRGFREIGKTVNDLIADPAPNAQQKIRQIKLVMNMVQNIFNAAGTLELAIRQPDGDAPPAPKLDESAFDPPRELTG